MISLTQLLNEQITLSHEDTELMYDAYKQMGLSNEWAIEDLQSLLEWLNGLPDTITLYPRIQKLSAFQRIQMPQIEIYLVE